MILIEKEPSPNETEPIQKNLIYKENGTEYKETVIS